MGARETALNALIACRKNGAWSNGALKQLIARDRLDSRDAALAARLCYGVMQNRAMQNAAAPHSTVAATISHRLFHMAFRSDSRSISR